VRACKESNGAFAKTGVKVEPPRSLTVHGYS